MNQDRKNRQCSFAGLVMAGLAFVSTAPASAATQTGSWSKPPVEPGRVTIYQSSALGLSAMDGMMRSLQVSGMLAYDIPSLLGTTAVADVFLLRWNGTSWVAHDSQRVWSEIIPISVYNYVTLPSVHFNLPYGGYYHVRVRISWSWYGALLAQKTYSFNSASDYFPFGDVVSGPGYVYIH